MSAFNLEAHGLAVKDVRRNLAPARLYAEAVREELKRGLAELQQLIKDAGDSSLLPDVQVY